MTPVYFTDRDLGKRFPEILREAGLRVERHADYFAHDTSDEDWLREIGRRGWVAITHDQRIRYKPNELKAVMDNNVALLVVVGRAPFQELANAFVMTEQRVRNFLIRNQPPYIAKVYRASASGADVEPSAPGRIELWYPRS